LKEILLLQDDHRIIIDFPYKNSLYIEDNSSNKPEVCYYDIFDSIQLEELSSRKQFSEWTKITRSCKSSLNKISLKNNFLFKGNNLIVLHSILPIFMNSIKLIYIDPPYNTGNTFVYKDKFSRSTWLIFMKNRLEIAKEFLQDDGVLVVQCDENEQAYLKVLLDELYGEENFLGLITIVMNPGGRDYRYLARTHEYLLIYGKSEKSILYPLKLNKKFPFRDNLGDFELRNLRNGNVRFHKENRPNLCYPFYVNINSEDQYNHYSLSLTPKKDSIKVYPKISQGIQTVWRWGKIKAEQNILINTFDSNLIARRYKDSFLIFEKYRNNYRLARTVWTEKEFQTSKGTRHIKEMFDERVFDYPKPELLIAKIIDITTKENDRVLDFFLGSGTTAAVAHKANRKWIGIEQMKYIETVTIPRLQKMLAGENGGASEHYQWNGGGNFIYGKLQMTDDQKFPFYKHFDNSNPITNQFYEK